MDVFTNLMQELVTDLPGSRGAVFVDWEGEAVGQAGEDTEATRIMGAHWGVVHGLLQRSLESRKLLPSDGLVMGFEDRQVVIKPVADGYLVVCDVARGTSPGQALALCGQAADRLREEM